MTRREIYPNAPIALVVAEIRHPVMTDITGPELGSFKSAFSQELPIMRWDETLDYEIPSGVKRAWRFPRFVSRDLRRSVTLQPEALVIESTVYTGWDDFRRLVELAMQAHERVKPLEGVDRIGLRYIDEIRVPDTGSPINWADWIVADLVGPQSIETVLEAPIEQSQGVAVVHASSRIFYTVRYGVADGQAVQSSDNLVRMDETTGPYFLLDLDGAWIPPQRSVPEFDIGETSETLDKLHQPIRALFESLITEKLRNEVLR